MRQHLPRDQSTCDELMGRKLDLRGLTHGNWTVIGPAPSVTTRGQTKRCWRVQCSCGATRVMVTGQWRSRKSCSTCAAKRHRTHGHAADGASKVYRAWYSMRDRCLNPNSTSYYRYGARGVQVCDRWNPKEGGSFENFLADMGEPPTDQHQLDKDKLGDGFLYSPETCCWLTPSENLEHTRRTAWVTYQGQRMLLTHAARLSGIALATITNRRRRGWPEKDWFNTPRNLKQNPARRIRRQYRARHDVNE